MKTYRDLREHLKALEDENLLQRVTRPINKDTELFPLVRWQFRGGIEEQQRKGWLFENVSDSKEKKNSYVTKKLYRNKEKDSSHFPYRYQRPAMITDRI